MTLPAKGSRARVLLEYLATVDKRQIEGIMVDLSDSLARRYVREAIADMYQRGHVINLSIREMSEERRTQFSDIVALSDSARYQMEDEKAEVIVAEPAPLVPPRQVNVLTGPPLSKSLFMKVTSNRDDDCDKWRDYKSLTAPFTKSA